KAPKNTLVEFPNFKDTLKKNIEIIHNFEPIITEDGDYNLYNKKLLITSFDTGYYAIPSINLQLIKNQDTVLAPTNETYFYVTPYILLDTIPVDTIYSSANAFVVRGHNGFKKEIEQSIPDSLKQNLVADTLAMVKQYAKEQFIQMFSSQLTQATTMYDQDQILKIAEAPEHSLFLVDKAGILAEFVVLGSLDTLFVNEFDQVQIGQPLYTVFRIKDINEDLYNTPFSFIEIWYSVKNFFAKYWWLILIILLVAAAIVYYFKYYKKGEKPIIFKAKPREPAHSIALRKLEKIRNEKIWIKGHIKEYYVQVTDVIREYIENRFEINAMEMTTREIMTSFSDTEYLNTDDTQKLSQMLDLADAVKFAKYQPLQNENDLTLNNSISFVENTKDENIETEDETLNKKNKLN
ncbi:hypothetical protein LJC11_01160, partial [Bacteroidales bacterium OttesenSCG-928-I21]|nr:hypothetical protein [Bacteroidales bacterium OttesenSCG-928-I21]